MFATNSKTWILATTLVAGSFFLLTAARATGYHQDRATEFIRRSMDRKFPVNVEGIVIQRDPSGEGSYERIKVVRARDGRRRQTVLQPLRMAGLESVDDGITLKVHLPDKRTLVVQDSPQKSESDTDQRMKLARRNYDFEITDRVKIADCWSVCVTARAHDEDMQDRRYYLEESSGYPLKLEIIGASGKPRLVFDTLAIKYPPTLDPEAFQLTPLPGTKTIRYARPRSVSSKSQAQKVVGFNPILPTRLPMGFTIQEMQLNGGSEWKSVVMRLTDGLVRATVYQWRASERKIESIEDSSVLDCGDIRLMVVSDLSPVVRMRILQGFAGQPNADTMPKAIRLTSVNALPMLPPRPRYKADRHPKLAFKSELIGVLWTFAQLDSQAGLGEQGLAPGAPYPSKISLL